MTRNEEQYLHFGSSNAMKILREGLKFRDIFVRLIELDETNPTLSESLHQICARLEFIENLKYANRFRSSKRQRGSLKYQLDRLITYLTLTCVDVASGREHKDFPYWLKGELRKDEPRGSIQKIVDDLFSADSREETGDKLVDGIRALYDKEYLDEQGIARKFKQFFTIEMQEWLRQWLVEVYVIIEGTDDLFMNSKQEWFNLDGLERCKRIAKHLFEVRNKYTHTVEHQPTMEDPKSGIVISTINGIEYSFNSFHKGGDINSRVVRTVGIRTDLIESDIVRFLVIVQMHKWLGIEDDPSVLGTFLIRASYRRWGFHFLNELDQNLEIIHGWCAYHLDLQMDAPVALLSKKNAEEFVKVHKLIQSDRWLTYNSSDAYLGKINKVNRPIVELLEHFNNVLPGSWKLSQLMREVVSEILKMDELRWLLSDIHEIRRNLFRTLDQPYY